MKDTFKVGGWVYDPETLVVCYGEDEYEVDLEQCSTSAQILDWICQFASKSWATSEAVGDLVMILHRLLRPQSNLCSRGVERGPLPRGDALRKLIAKHIREMEIFNQWEQSMRQKQGKSDPFITPEDWQDLLRMEREAR
jgi:hypothetical protein